MPTESPALTHYEFFAGGGMARLGLGPRWRCVFANDLDAEKAAVYAANFGDDHLKVADVWDLSPGDLPGRADLAWASSPCQDVSLAGARGGLAAKRSGAFFGFWRLMQGLIAEGRAPRMIVIENVAGLITSHNGADFAALCAALAGGGYRFGAVQVDAAHFLPQSRPRLFVIAVADSEAIGPELAHEDDGLEIPCLFHSRPIRAAARALPPELRARWLSWILPTPPARNTALIDLLDDAPETGWRTEIQTAKLLMQMSALNRAKVEAVLASGRRAAGTVYRRTRTERGKRMQRAEARFDGIAGCLRTPGGGSSKQFVLLAEDGRLRTRLLTARETARLMGLPEDYRLPDSATGALKITGDGVAVPVVRWLAEHVLEPVLTGAVRRDAAA